MLNEDLVVEVCMCTWLIDMVCRNCGTFSLPDQIAQEWVLSVDSKHQSILVDTDYSLHADSIIFKATIWSCNGPKLPWWLPYWMTLNMLICSKLSLQFWSSLGITTNNIKLFKVRPLLASHPSLYSAKCCLSWNLLLRLLLVTKVSSQESWPLRTSFSDPGKVS